MASSSKGTAPVEGPGQQGKPSGTLDSAIMALTPLNVNTMLDAALAYAGHGLAVFPCSRDKKPKLLGGFKVATTDLDKIRGWWGRWPDASIGLPTGRGVGWVLDVDQPDGPATLADLETKHGPLPATREQKTGGGGRQLLFKWPTDREVRNSAGKLGVGLDVRGVGGYVIVAPSGHPSGGKYSWVNDLALAEAPAWLLELVCPSPKAEVLRLEPKPATKKLVSTTTPYGQSALGGEVARVVSAPVGERNHRLNTASFRVGQLAAAGEVDLDEAQLELAAAAAEAGLDADEIGKTVASGLRAGAQVPRGPAAAGAPDPRPAFNGLDFAACSAGDHLNAQLDPLTWVIRDVMLAGTVGLLAGPPGVGKSTLANQIAAGLACGLGVEGIVEPGVQGAVLVLSGEEDARIVPRRVRRLHEHLFPPAQLLLEEDEAEVSFREGLYVVPLAGTRLRLLERAGAGAATVSSVYEDLLDKCKGIPNLKLVVVDCLSRFYGLEENDNSSATVFAEVLERLAAETGAGVLVLHHISKAAMRSSKTTFRDALEMGAARGATGFAAAVRAQMSLTTLTKSEAQKELRPATPPEEGEYLALAFPKISYGRPRDIVFLRRADGGMLVHVNPPEDEESEELEDRLIELITAEVERREKLGEQALTIKALADVFPSRWKALVPLATKTAVKAAAQAAIVDGQLFEVIRRSGNNKQVTYLATTPDSAAGTGRRTGPDREAVR